MTRRFVVTCDRCHKEDSFSQTIKYPDDAGRLEDLELCRDCWVDFHDWRWMRKRERGLSSAPSTRTVENG